MAPVIQTTPKDRQEKPKRPGEKRSDFICRVKYCNTLPDIPFDPKFITYPFDSNRFVNYKPTSLEKNYKHDLLTEHDLGVTIDLINPDTYVPPPGIPELAKEDEKLLEEEMVTPHDSKRSRFHNKIVPWMKKTEYISTEFNRYGASSDKTETKVGYNVKKRMKDETLYMDRDSQIAAINETFDAVKRDIKEHPGKPGVTPVEILPIFPDFKLWKYPFAQVMFDTDPAPMSKMEEMSQAMIRGVMDESGEQFVAYFLPTEDTMNKRRIDQLETRDYLEGEEYIYKMAREYNWIVKNKATKGWEENYFFVFRDDCICYNELETRVRLSKRRTKGSSSNSKLIVKHRPLNEGEFKTETIRMSQLEPPQEEDEQQNQESFDIKKEESTEKIEFDQESIKENGETKVNKEQEPNQQDDEEKSSSSSSSSGSSSSDSSGSSSSESDSDDDDDEEVKTKTKQDAAAIFGSGSESD